MHDILISLMQGVVQITLVIMLSLIQLVAISVLTGVDDKRIRKFFNKYLRCKSVQSEVNEEGDA